ncbi:MAG: FHA domain-containing protein [Myxococcales bacterium FL481]|nr:MAG: FHA domain-containing protein [Myxococcales bacterium FL481]
MSDASKRRPDAGRDARNRRRPLREKLQMRAALVLEEAGELLEAARLYDHAGEPDHAAALRLEHARTIDDDDAQLAALRQACSLASGEGPSVAALHQRLATVLGQRAEHRTDATGRRRLRAEQARHLELAGAGAAAGRIYESLGDLTTAARAYQAAGAITELELVHATLDDEQARDRAHRKSLERLDHARRVGLRRDAWEGLRVADEAARARGEPALELGSRREQFALTLFASGRCSITWRDSTRRGTLRVCATPRLSIGRLPTADIPVDALDLSREHVCLRFNPDEDRIEAIDPGSKAGSFLDGVALEPDRPVPVTNSAELGLGLSTALDLMVNPGPPSVLVSPPDPATPTLFLPNGGPLQLTRDFTAAAQLHYNSPFFVLDVAASHAAKLNRQRLRPGSRIELVDGDLVELLGDEPLVLEVHA